VTDLRGRIEQVLRDHQWYFVGNLGVPGMPDRRGYKCHCGWETRDDDGRELDDPHTHVADAVLAVLRPDIDTVAEAICQAMYPHEPPYENQLRMQHDSTGYRRMARAAVDSWIGQP